MEGTEPPRWSMDTLVVHAGRSAPVATPTAPALYPSNTFQPGPEEMDAILGGVEAGYTYTRHGNPTTEALADAVRTLEGGEVAVAYGSGMAAIDAALYATGLSPGDTLLLSRDLYGATVNLAQEIWALAGVRVIQADLTRPETLEEVFSQERPRTVLVEVLSNPLLRVVDVPTLCAFAHQVGCQVIVDNTFTTPLLCQPLALGADLVVHSATKYLGGHGDATGGVVVAREPSYRSRLTQYLKLRGAVLGPLEAWLLHRGLRTLALRFGRQVESAHVLARRLWESGRFVQVHYPLLPHHPSAHLAQRLLGGRGGAVVTVELEGGREEVFRFLRSLRLVGSATTVGDIYTLCLYPFISSHRNLGPAQRQAAGITEGMVRISVGIEDPEDVAQDLLEAAQAARKP